MKTSRKSYSRSIPSLNIVELRLRLEEAEEALDAIRSGEVDAVVVAGKKGDPGVQRLEGADHPYRVLIESMNEGALTVSAGKLILFANECFARMVKCSLEQIIGSSFRRFLSPEDQATLKSHLRGADRFGAKFQAILIASDGTRFPAQISIRPQDNNGFSRTIIGMVVTDMSEARRNEELLRALTHRVVQVQETERQRVGFELHDNITQLLCAVVFRSQSLVDTLSAGGGPSRDNAVKLRDMLGKIAEEVVRISHNLGPSSLDHLGLAAVLHDTKTEFADRTGVSVKLTCLNLTAQLPAAAELALYRILQEALRNVEKHANARHVVVCLSQEGAFVQLAISDDGIGFDPDRRSVKHEMKRAVSGFSACASARATSVGRSRSNRTSALERRLKCSSP